MTSAGSLVARYAAVVCDLDGVVYRGPSAVPHAVEVLGAVRPAGALRHQQRVPVTG